MKCDMCGMMMKDENEHRMHMEMMRSMMMHMMKCMEMGMDNMPGMMGHMGSNMQGSGKTGMNAGMNPSTMGGMGTTPASGGQGKKSM